MSPLSMTDSNSPPPASSADQRQQARQGQTGSITMSIADQQLSGQVSNASASGIMFLAEGSLRITVEYESAGQTLRRSGRLVRVQGMNSEQTAYAVEFDAE